MERNEPVKIGFPYGRVVKTLDAFYELHWYTTITGDNRKEVCEKCGVVYYDTKPCKCNESTPYRYVNTIEEAEKILSQKPFQTFQITENTNDT